MAPLLKSKLRFSDVVFAIDTSPKALRNWLQRDQVTLISERSESGWQSFSLADVAVLSLVRRVVDFGINVATASRIARSILLEIQGEDWLSYDSLRESPGAFSLFWVNRAVLIYSVAEDNAQWEILVWDMWKPFPAAAPDAAIVLKPEQTLRTALERAVTGADDSDLEWESPDTLAAMQELLRTIKGASE